MHDTIHGATGAQGRPVAERLLARGRAVRSLSRAADRAAGIGTPVAADLDDPASLRRAYEGTTGVFLHLPIPTSPAQPQAWARNVVDAVAAARPAHIVYSTSGVPVEEPVSGDVAALRREGDAALLAGLRDTGATVSALGPRLFRENLLLPPVWSGILAEGVLRYPLDADVAVSWVSHLDVADAVTALLTGEVPAGGYEIGAPAVTGDDLATELGRALGRDVVYEAVTPERFGALLEPLLGAEAAGSVAGFYRSVAGEESLAVGADAVRFPLPVRSTGAWVAAVAAA